MSRNWAGPAFFGLVLFLNLVFIQGAYAGTVTLRPNGDPGTKIWTPSTGTANWSIINRSDLGTSTWICASSGTAGDLYDLTTASVYQGVTAVNVRINAALGQQVLVLSDDRAGVNLEVSGSLVGTTTYQDPPSPGLGLLQSCVSAGFGSYGVLSQSFSGSWTQAQTDGMRIFVGRQQVGGADSIRISQAEAVVTYTDPPTVDQSAWRAYQNADSLTPGSPLAATNTAAELPVAGSAFRIRIGATVSGAAWSANYGSNKLQFTTKNAGTCATSSGWVDVASGSGDIRWNDNASAADGATISSNGNDPTTSGTKAYQQYRESNNHTNPNAVALTNVALWDFSLKDFSSAPGTRYCFRLANATGTIAINYSNYPEILVVGDYGVAVVDAGGTEVTSPSVVFDTLTSLTSTCQLSTGAFGVSAQRLRITNNILTNGWNVSLAATGGSTATWMSGSSSYDYNDGGGSPAGCSDSGDSDNFAGQLTIKPSTATNSPKSGCTTTGVSLGANASYVEGSISAITVLSASSAADRFCYWDLTGIGLDQRVPASTPNGSYTIDMTATVTAS